MTAKFAEVEERVAHAGVLPVDEPQSDAVVDEVRVQQVVVAGPRSRTDATALDLVGDLFRAFIRRGHPDAVLVRGGAVRLDNTKTVEPPRKAGAVVEPTECGADAVESTLPTWPSTYRVTR